MNTKRRLTLFSLILFCSMISISGLCFCAEAEEIGENLLVNGDFSLINAEGMPEGWYTDAYFHDDGYTLFSVDVHESQDGNYAVRIQNCALNDARFAQDVPVEPETVYCLSGDILADQITQGRGANLSIDGVYAFSESVYDTEGEWYHIEYYGQTGSDQDTLTVFARLGGYGGESLGTAWFDHLSLTAVEKLPDHVLADQWYVSSVEYDDTADDDADVIPNPAWPVLLGIILIYALVFAGLVFAWRDGQSVPELTTAGKPAFFVIMMIIALAVRMILSYFIDGYAVDVNCFNSWGWTMSHNSPLRFYPEIYGRNSFCDYPPLYMLVCGINSRLSEILHASEGWTRVIFRFFPSLCDILACSFLYHTVRKRHMSNGRYCAMVLIIMAFNPATILNSAAWGQMDSVLCLMLLLTAVWAIEGKWKIAVPAYALSILVKPQALMLGPLGLTFMIITWIRTPKNRRNMLTGCCIGLFAMLAVIIPFNLDLPADWIFNLYGSTLASYPHPTVNTANMYYLLGANWGNLESAAHPIAPILLLLGCLLYIFLCRKNQNHDKSFLPETILCIAGTLWFTACLVFSLNWICVGSGAMAFSFVIVLSFCVRSRSMLHLPYWGALLFILLYVFGIKMHERYLFPALMLLCAAWVISKDRRIIFLIILFSSTLFLNAGIVLDNSIRLGSSMGHLNNDTVWLADCISVIQILGAGYAVLIGREICMEAKQPPLKVIRAIFPASEKSDGRIPLNYHPDRRLHWNWKDSVLLCLITVLFSYVSLTTLGSMKAPQTGWTSSGQDEKIIFDLNENYESFNILYFGKVSKNDFLIETSPDGEHWEQETWAEMNEGSCWKWLYVTASTELSNGKRKFYDGQANIISFSGRYVRLTSMQAGLALNEVLFRTPEGTVIHASVIHQDEAVENSPLYSDAYALTDEPDTLEALPGWLGGEAESVAQPGWWNSTYFDEIYHARTAFEMAHKQSPYEWTHPPLGKYLMSLMISMMGMNPFAWRFAGALAGIAMLPGIYLLIKQMSKKTWLAACGALLLSLDCQHLTQTQIATIDSFAVLFILFAYFFMLRFIQTDLKKQGLASVLINLAMSGFFMGLAIASKWIGVYAGAGLALLFAWHCIRSVDLSRKAAHLLSKRDWSPEERMILTSYCEKDSSDGQQGILRKLFIICLWCIVFFIIVPVIIYLISYIPHMAYNTKIHTIGDYLEQVWKTQVSMLSYHGQKNFGSDHPFYSPWWEWPINGKPMYYASEQFRKAGASSFYSIFCFGNPAVWYVGLAGIAGLVILWICDKRYRLCGSERIWHLGNNHFDPSVSFILISFLAQYVPWILVPRGTYIYHYFASVPFLIGAVCVCLNRLDQRRPKISRSLAAILVAAALILAVILFPYASGMSASAQWLDIGKRLLRIWY